ncbi:sulfotransferase [Rhizobium grahamii]|uniref:NodH sulfotransferase n=1 Tax=Rhizobium grahamii CCGE 502 TaxID=990285 RepID=S3HJK6_9HYPH|nr:sulfotransferase [Rhizobium grahamii]EPE93726.1 NodH sulfotransferase [Rhizobium grahamii CCGE 502]
MNVTTRLAEPFVILGMPRSGTHYLEALLNQHPEVHSSGELLNTFDEDWSDKDRLLLPDRELLEYAYRSLPRIDKNLLRIGCKINEPQFEERPGFFDELAGWPGLRVIFLKRRNTLESLRSLVQARQSGKWLKLRSIHDAAPPPSVRLRIEDCEIYFQKAEQFLSKVRASFAPSNLLVIDYEDLISDTNACLSQVLKFMGLAPLQRVLETAIERQETRPLERSIQNYDELRLHFQDGPYSKFFDDPCQHVEL